ncbi:FKBP-type peptidyl-prolyl cis-trans isomerase [Aquipuribacter nitratireducens]|uniref:peptidylprolyl isomerase n=1 Tax=Aquipuribacter nitratireducens TaxID=650104 RepID=A0ABW0GIT1_9MICO
MSSSRPTTAPPAHPLSSGARRASRPLVLGAAALLAVGVAACGSGEATDDASGAAGGNAGGSGDLSGVSVDGAYGEVPTVEFDTPFEVEESASTVLDEGDGEELTSEDTVTLDYWVFSGSSGEQLESSRDAAPISLPLGEGQAAPGIIDALVGIPDGSRVVAAVAPPEPPEGASADPSAETIVFVMDVLGVVPERAEGEVVEPPEGVPSVTTDDAGDVESLDVSGVEAPEELVVTTLIEGEGEPVEAGSTVTIHYEGVLASDGTVFDSSWDRGTAATFPLDNLIPAWRDGLVGVPVGSRVVMQVPPEQGYGAEGSPPTIPGDADLVFVVDVLAATAPPA